MPNYTNYTIHRFFTRVHTLRERDLFGTGFLPILVWPKISIFTSMLEVSVIFHLIDSWRKKFLKHSGSFFQLILASLWIETLGTNWFFSGDLVWVFYILGTLLWRHRQWTASTEWVKAKTCMFTNWCAKIPSKTEWWKCKTTREASPTKSFLGNSLHLTSSISFFSCFLFLAEIGILCWFCYYYPPILHIWMKNHSFNTQDCSHEICQLHN